MFIGDSVTRQLFFQTIHIVDRALPSEPPDDNQKHRNYEYTSQADIELSFIWDPFLNSTRTRDVFTLSNGHSVSTSSSIRTPAMVILGTGLWFLRYPHSGGLPHWEQLIESTLATIFKLQPEIADMVIFLPVENVIPEKLLPERRKTIMNPDIEAMNADLESRIRSFLDVPESNYRKGRYPSLAFPSVFNKMLDASQTMDGLHYFSNITAAQSNILLNLRCNDVLPKKYPLDKTCCRSYPRPSLYQLFVLLSLTLWGPVAYSFLVSPRASSYDSLLTRILNVLIRISQNTFDLTHQRKHKSVNNLWLEYPPYLFIGQDACFSQGTEAI